MDYRRSLHSSRNRWTVSIVLKLALENTHPSKSSQPAAQMLEGIEEGSIWPVLSSSLPPRRSDQTLQQILELADFVIDGEGGVGDVEDFHRQDAIIVLAGELSN